MSGPPTDVRTSVRLLLRARSTGSEAPAQVRLGGWVAAILGPAVASHWPPQAMLPGALEGLVWTTGRQAQRAAEELRKHPDVLAVDAG